MRKDVASEFPDDEQVTAIVKVDEIKSRALTMPERALEVRVTDQSSLDIAERFRADVKTLLIQITETFDPQISQAHKLHASLIREKRKFTDPLEDAERIVNRGAIAPYLAAEREKREAVERLRAEAEAKARAEADKALTKAKAAEAKGDTAKADKILNQAYAKVEEIRNAAPALPDAPEARSSLRRDWKFAIVHADMIPREYLMPDEKKIGNIIRATEGEEKILGVRVWFEDRVQ